MTRNSPVAHSLRGRVAIRRALARAAERARRMPQQRRTVSVTNNGASGNRQVIAANIAQSSRLTRGYTDKQLF